MTPTALGWASVREWPLNGSDSRMALVVVREAIIRDHIPRRPRCDEGVELRADARLAVE